MKRPLRRLAGWACGLFAASVSPAPADFVIAAGTTTRTTFRVNYLDSTGITRVLRDNAKERYLGGYSSLGNPGWFVFMLNSREKTALRIVDETGDGPKLFPNFNDTDLGYELHKQFNKKSWIDIPGIGDTTDIRYSKWGALDGPRRLVNLRNAGFQIEVAPKLSGFHLETRSSWDFGIDSSVSEGYSAGCFYESATLRHSVKLQVKLTDEANVLGGGFLAALGVAQDSLEDKGWTIQTVP